MAGTYIKKVRIEYYQVVESNESGQDRLFDLRKIINKLDDLPLERRKKEYYQDGARLDKIKYNKIDNYWYLNFVRLRQTGIPSKASETSETEPIKLLDDEYIGEEVPCIYDVDNHILVLQRNRDSLSSSGLELYLNYFNCYNSFQKSLYEIISIKILGENLTIDVVVKYFWIFILLYFALSTYRLIKIVVELIFHQPGIKEDKEDKNEDYSELEDRHSK